MSIKSVMPSNHLILCPPLLLLPSIFPSIRVFSSGLALHIRWPKYWSFSFSNRPSNEYSGLTSFRIDCVESFRYRSLWSPVLPLSSLVLIPLFWRGLRSTPAAPVWPWVRHLTSRSCLTFPITGLRWRLNILIFIKCLKQNLTSNKHFLSVSWMKFLVYVCLSPQITCSLSTRTLSVYEISQEIILEWGCHFLL